jgi:hypothetical protein
MSYSLQTWQPALTEPRAPIAGEAETANAAEGERGYRAAFLSTDTAGRRERRLAVVFIVLSAIAFAAAAPFARVPLINVPAFIPAYEAALVISDLITALLLLGQFAQLRSPSLLALAAGYLFNALMILPHALSFPDLFAPMGLIGGNSQTTAWLYMLWHAGFPVFVMAYIGFKDRETRRDPAAGARGSIPVAIAVVVGVVVVLTLLAVTGNTVLPEIMQGNGYTSVTKFVVATVWALSLAALLLLWWNQSPSVLDL